MITVKAAGRKDARAISELMVPVAKAQIAREFVAEGQEALLSGMTPAALEQNMLQGYPYYVAFDQEPLVGVIGMRGYSHVYHLFVAEEMQHQGVGRKLWDRASRDSLAAINLSEFTVYSSRYAEAFYHRLGFRRTGDEKERQGVIAIPMRLLLKE
ncbi:MAG: GNAT family N-acetyltransferase [Gammaproteobacteria bacterium]|nr:GNAT family N-acetyltransferase [Gammaproteobacteria bacterium]MDH3767753.1 GNAT family N-acetyltransferase [Gammaproteobacteria bacterium]